MKIIILFVFLCFLAIPLSYPAFSDAQNALEASLTEDEISDTEAELDRLRAERNEAEHPEKAQQIEKEEMLEEGESELEMD